MSLALKKDTVDSLPLFTKNSQKFHGGRAVFFFDSGQKSYSFRCVFQFFSMSELWHVHGVEMKQARVKNFLNLNRYRRGLETCPQANMAKMSTLFSSLFFRRVRATSMTQRRAENTLANLSHSCLYRLSLFSDLTSV